MTNLIKLDLGNGWKPHRRDPDQIEATKLLIGLFVKECQDIPNLRFNELTGLIEVDGKEQTNADLDLLYIDLEESGWSINKSTISLSNTGLQRY